MTGVVGSASELGEDVRRALGRHILTLADSKRLLGIRYSDWLLGSPSIETGIAASSMAQDEWGHARLLYAMLKDLDRDPAEVEHHRDAAAYTSVDPLDDPLPDWAAAVVAMVVVDGALRVALEGFSAGVYDQARSRVPKMLSEESFHEDLARAWFRRLAGGAAGARERLSSVCRETLPRTLAWLAPADDASELLVGAGITSGGQELLAAYRDRLGPELERVGVDPASVTPERSGWDESRGRGPGHPGEEAVERARGDRNRALFVE